MNMRDSINHARVAGPLPQPDGAVEFEFRFPATDSVFPGHFPKRPLLPGVFQLEMSHLAAEWALQTRLSLREVTKAKFLRPIVPEDSVHLRLKWSENEGVIVVRASFSVRNQPAGESQLRLCRSA